MPVVFPAIIQSDITASLNIPKAGPAQYETETWTSLLIVTNIIVFGLLALYKKNKMPKSIERNLKKLFSFEISKKSALVTMIILLGIYAAATSSEMGTEENFEDYDGVLKKVDKWNNKNANENRIILFMI